MSTSQVYGHNDKMARTNTHRTSQKIEHHIEKQGYLYHFYGSPNWNPFWMGPLTSCCLIHRAINSGGAASD